MNYVAHEGTALVEVPALPTYDNLRGEQAQRRFRGPPALVLAKFAELKGQGVQTMRIAEMADGIAYELSADYPGTVGSDGQIDPSITPVLTDWTLEPVEFAKSIWDYKPVTDEFDKIGFIDEGLYQIQRIRNLIDAVVRGDTTVPEEALTPVMGQVPDKASGKTVTLTIKDVLDFIEGSGLSRDVFRQLIYNLLRGTTTYSPNSWTLRRTRRVPSTSAFQEEVTNVGRMLRPSTLFNEGFNDNLIRTRLPLGGYWLKKAPFDRPVGDGNREVSTDYVWTESYSLFLFGSPV